MKIQRKPTALVSVFKNFQLLCHNFYFIHMTSRTYLSKYDIFCFRIDDFFLQQEIHYITDILKINLDYIRAIQIINDNLFLCLVNSYLKHFPSVLIAHLI